MVKVARIALIFEKAEKAEPEKGSLDYKEACGILWDLQKQTRSLKNKAVQICWENYDFGSVYKKRLNKKYVYNTLKSNSNLYSKNLDATVKDVCDRFANSAYDISAGNISVLCYKSNQPLDIDKQSISLYIDNGNFCFDLSLLNTPCYTKYGLTSSKFTFKALIKDNSVRTILERCVDNIYSISASKLIYDKKKKQWFLNLSYKFDSVTVKSLDKDKILGVDLGIAKPVVASVYGDLKRFIIPENEIIDFRQKIEARKRALLKQGICCGDGRIGHGIKTRNKPTYKIEDKIARFRDTCNHKYSRALIEYAIKQNCGTIQMEDLTGITDLSDKFLKNWTYYDLQAKIEYKAKEAGIEVIKVKPQYTSQRCSKCGFISKENRPNQAHFECKNCGFKENADYNASQNLSIKNIAEIISEATSAKA